MAVPPVARRLHSTVVALVALVAALAVTIGSPASSPVAAQDLGGPEVPYATPADGAAAWLVRQFDAEGGTWAANVHADFILALAATNGSRAKAMRSLELMEASTAAYVDLGNGNYNHGGVAKVMLAAASLGADVKDFGGYDLEAILRDAVIASGPDTGRVGTATTFTQPLAIMALARTPGGAPPSTVTWLAAKQCPDGGFSFGACSFADSDYTGIAASAFDATGAVADRDEALDWLESRQAPDGGFTASNSPTDSNTNSTGLAVAALRAAGRSATVVDAGAEYVAGVQKQAGADSGAIPWKASVDGSLFLATTQAVLAWGAPTYADLAFPTIVGEPCPPAQGVTVVVDLTYFDDEIRVGCAPGPQVSGTTAMQAAGFTIGWHPDYPGGGPGLGGAVCTLEGVPTAGYPECWFTGFWSYFNARADAQWEFSSCGIDNRTPRQGSVEGWRYEPDVAGHIASAPLVDARWPQVTLTAPATVTSGATATLAVTVSRTAPRVAPQPDEDPEPCSLPPETGPEDYTPTVTGPVKEGLVQIEVDGTPFGSPVPVAADGTVSVPAALPDGTNEVSAHFLGTATDLAAPSVASTVLVAMPTTTTLTADPTTAPTGTDVALSAMVATSAGPVTRGQVQFEAGTTSLGAPVPVDARGKATTTTSFSSVGDVSVTARYLGSPAGLASTSAPVTVTVSEGELDRLVRDLYQAVLGRLPNAVDQAYWVGRFETGASPAKLAEALARTREGWAQVVKQHYRLALDREGDTGGVTYWTDQLQRSNRPDTLLTNLFSSDEVFVRRGGATNTGFFTYLYDRVLDRSPDPGGLAYWVNRLDTYPGQKSIGRKDAARSLVFTAEAIRRQVDANHRAVCGTPTPATARAELTTLFRASRLNPSTLRAAIVIRGCP